MSALLMLVLACGMPEPKRRVLFFLTHVSKDRYYVERPLPGKEHSTLMCARGVRGATPDNVYTFCRHRVPDKRDGREGRKRPPCAWSNDNRPGGVFAASCGGGRPPPRGLGATCPSSMSGSSNGE